MGIPPIFKGLSEHRTGHLAGILYLVARLNTSSEAGKKVVHPYRSTRLEQGSFEMTNVHENLRKVGLNLKPRRRLPASAPAERRR